MPDRYRRTMRFLFVSVDATGRVFPLLPLADAARRAGHEVLFACADGLFGVLDRAGFARTRIGMSHDRAVERAQCSWARPDVPLADQMPELGALAFGDLLPRSMFATTGSVIERYRPDMVIAEIGSPGAWFAAEYHGVAARAVTWGPVVPTENARRAAEYTGKVAADIGVSGVVPYLDICPDSLQTPGFRSSADRAPLRATGYTFPGDDLPAIVTERDRPLVYATISSVADTIDAHLLREMAVGLSRLPVEVLVTAGATSDEVGELPANVHLLTWVPQSLLMPHVALAVHHGGPGVMMNALAAGVPQLVLPDTYGIEPGSSRVVGASGAGAVLPQHEVDADRVHELAGALLTDTSVRTVVAALAEEIAAMPDPDRVVESLETS